MANFAHGKVHYERVPVSGLPPDAPDDDAESGEQDFAKRGAVTPTDGDHYRLSHDDLAALGGGDTEAGHAVLHGVFPFMLQENGVVPSWAVTILGHGDHLLGRKVLDQFIAKVRERSEAS